MHRVWYKAEKNSVFEKKSKIAHYFFVTKSTYLKTISHNFFVTKATYLKPIFLKSYLKMDIETCVTL